MRVAYDNCKGGLFAYWRPKAAAPQKKSNASVSSKPIRGLKRKSSTSGGSRFAAAALGRQYANNPPLQLSKIPSF